MRTIATLVLLLCLVISTTHGLRQPKAGAAWLSKHNEHHHQGADGDASLLMTPSSVEDIVERYGSTLTVRGGYITRAFWNLVMILFKNPVLVLLMSGSVFMGQYGDMYEVPYARMIQNACGFGIAIYVFYLLVQWQKSTKDTFFA